MKMYIPEIGDIIKLNNDWKFSLYKESRNSSLYKHFFNEILNGYLSSTENKKYKELILKKDTILIIDRIYIRKGNSDFSSISFRIKNFGKNLRFWAKLNDVNNINFDLIYKNDINDKFNSLINSIKENKIDLINITDIYKEEFEYKTKYNFKIKIDNDEIFILIQTNKNFNKFDFIFSYNYIDFDGKQKEIKKTFGCYEDEVLYNKLKEIKEKFLD